MSIVVKKDLFDKNASLYVLSCLMRRPLLLQEERYAFVSTDFNVPLHQMVFFAIYNMAQSGVEKISPQDVDLYLKQYSAQYEFYKREKGYEFVLQCYQTSEGSDDKQFDYYYQRLKKFSMLRDLEGIGIDTSDFYDTEKNALNRDLEDEKLNKTKLNAIPEHIRSLLVEIENKHIGKDNSTSQNAAKGIRQLVADLKAQPEVGLPLDGDIVNFAARGARLGKLYTYSAPSGAGKALPNSTLIPLANGEWKTVGEIKAGDVLLDRHGKETTVLKTFPQGIKDVYKVTFKDGRIALCCKDHLWTYHNECARDYNKLETKTLGEIIQLIKENGIKSDSTWRYSVPFNEPVQYIEKKYKLDPYLLGLLLGDGSFRESSSNRNLTFSDGREELVKNFEQLGWTYHRHSLNNYTYSFKDNNCSNVHVNEFCNEYNLSCLYNVLTEDKVIPQEYMIGSIQQRLSLLQGLLDTDGSVDKNGRVSFTSINNKLVEQVKELCYSLGMTCSVRTDKRSDKYTTGVCYEVQIMGKPEMKANLFRLSYKKELINNWFKNGKRKEKYVYNPIISIDKLNYSEEMTCFLVDNEEHLFLMNDYIVTHNTRYMVGNACAISMPYIDDRGRVVIRGAEGSDEDNYQKILFVTTEQQADEIQTLILAYVSGVNEKNILLGNYTPEQYDRIQKALDIIEKYEDNFIIECIPDPSIAMIKARLAKYIVQDGVEYIFYDYIFSSPGLLSEFRDVAVREDVALMMLSNSLKETAMMYNVFIQSATQLNDGWSKKTTGLRDQNCLRGSKAIADWKAF